MKNKCLHTRNGGFDRCRMVCLVGGRNNKHSIHILYLFLLYAAKKSILKNGKLDEYIYLTSDMAKNNIE